MDENKADQNSIIQLWYYIICFKQILLEGAGFLYAHCFFKICPIFFSCMWHYKLTHFFFITENPSIFSLFILLLKTVFMLSFEYCLVLQIRLTVWPNLDVNVSATFMVRNIRAARYPPFEFGSQQCLVYIYFIKNWCFHCGLDEWIEDARIKNPWALFLSLYFKQVIPVYARFHMGKEKIFFSDVSSLFIL